MTRDFAMEFPGWNSRGADRFRTLACRAALAVTTRRGRVFLSAFQPVGNFRPGRTPPARDARARARTRAYARPGPQKRPTWNRVARCDSRSVERSNRRGPAYRSCGRTVLRLLACARFVAALRISRTLPSTAIARSPAQIIFALRTKPLTLLVTTSDSRPPFFAFALFAMDPLQGSLLAASASPLHSRRAGGALTTNFQE